MNKSEYSQFDTEIQSENIPQYQWPSCANSLASAQSSRPGLGPAASAQCRMWPAGAEPELVSRDTNSLSGQSHRQLRRSHSHVRTKLSVFCFLLVLRTSSEPARVRRKVQGAASSGLMQASWAAVLE